MALIAKGISGLFSPCATTSQEIIFFALLGLLQLLVQCADLSEVWVEFGSVDSLNIRQGYGRYVSGSGWLVGT